MSQEELTFHFLWPDQGSFWRWTVDAEIVVWASGDTLAFYPEIDAVLTRLQPNGFPRFEEILLVMAACRTSWRTTQGGAQHFGQHVDEIDPASWGGFPGREWKEQLLTKLDRVHEMAERAGCGMETTLEILEVVFLDHSDHLEAGDAASVLEMIRQGTAATLIRDHFRVAQISPSIQGTLKTLRNLNATLDALPDLDIDGLKRTGLPGELGAADIQRLPFVERVRSLVRQLREEDETEMAGLARIAQSLSAVVQLPRPLSEPEELPLGGYSDIANRGNLDRLLVSELAQDPEVLAVRVALNEALYLRREAPPKQPARRRAIFVDVGIRLWGLPRVFAHSLALAFVMQSENDAEITVSTAQNGELWAAKVDTRDGLADLLERLTPEPHPGQAVSQFLHAFMESGLEIDCIVITHPAVLTDRHFRDSLRQHPDAEFFLATVDGLGNYRLQARSSAGIRELQHATLDLESLLRGAEQGPLADQLRHREASLPLILRLSEFPLLFSPQLEFQNTAFHAEAGLLGFTRSGLLYHWRHSNEGARLLTDSLPRGVVSWREIDPAGDRAWLLIPRADRTATLVTANLDAGETTQTKLNHGIETVIQACRIDEMLVLIGESRMAAHRLADGQKLSTLETARCYRGSGRFVRIGHHWYAITAGLGGITLTEVPELDGRTTALVWESSNWDAPLAMAANLDTYCLNDPVESISGAAVARFSSLRGLSADGSRLLIQAKPPGTQVDRTFLVDLNRDEVKEVREEADLRLEPVAVGMIRKTQNLRNHYAAVAVSPGGSLHLRSGRKEFVLKIPQGLPRLQWSNESDPFVAREREFWKPFEPFEPAAGARFRLEKATWQDGSAAYLDQRGLLHLKSSDSNLAEVTLVLKEGMVSGWASSGEYTGNAYFAGDHALSPPSQFLAYIAQFAATAARSEVGISDGGTA